jgi:hypothetical protein
VTGGSPYAPRAAAWKPALYAATMFSHAAYHSGECAGFGSGYGSSIGCGSSRAKVWRPAGPRMRPWPSWLLRGGISRASRVGPAALTSEIHRVAQLVERQLVDPQRPGEQLAACPLDSIVQPLSADPVGGVQLPDDERVNREAAHHRDGVRVVALERHLRVPGDERLHVEPELDRVELEAGQREHLVLAGGDELLGVLAGDGLEAVERSGESAGERRRLVVPRRARLIVGHVVIVAQTRKLSHAARPGRRAA